MMSDQSLTSRSRLVAFLEAKETGQVTLHVVRGEVAGVDCAAMCPSAFRPRHALMTSRRGSRIRIALVQADRTFELFWLHTTTDIYFGVPGVKAHFSYHRDGRFHYTRVGGRDIMGDEIPPSQLRGHRALMILPFWSSLAGLPIKPYQPGRKETAVLVDVDATAPGGAVLVGLIEPKCVDLLNKVLEAHGLLYGTVRETILITDVSPWPYVTVLPGSVAWLGIKEARQ